MAYKHRKALSINRGGCSIPIKCDRPGIAWFAGERYGHIRREARRENAAAGAINNIIPASARRGGRRVDLLRELAN